MFSSKKDNDPNKNGYLNSSSSNTKGDMIQGNENRVLILLLILSGSLLISLLAIVVLLFNNRALAERENTYVQMNDGFTKEIREFNVSHREASTIKQTVSTWVQLTFEWDNRIPGSSATDKGFEINEETIPTKSYLASYIMQEGFRQQFLTQLGSEVVPPDVFTGQRRSTVRIYDISNPRQVGEGTWEIDVVSSRIETVGGREDREVEFNRTFTVEAIPPIESALKEQESSAWRKQVYDLTTNGLIITQIEPLDV